MEPKENMRMIMEPAMKARRVKLQMTCFPRLAKYVIKL